VRELGRLLVLVGGVSLVLGAVLLVADRLPWFGRLPGDIVLHRGPVTFYLPLGTSLVVSVVVTILLNLFWRR
jgi:hypothetical protein